MNCQWNDVEITVKLSRQENMHGFHDNNGLAFLMPANKDNDGYSRVSIQDTNSRLLTWNNLA